MLVRVSVVDIGVVRMLVAHSCVRVLVRVRLGRIDAGGVGVLMVGIVDVRMGVGERLMRVRVLVTLGQVQPDADRHEGGCYQEPGGERLLQ